MDDYGKCVLGTALRILKNRQDAEDVFQNTFIKAYTKTMPFKSEEHLKAWLIRVAYNECVSVLRSGWKKNVDLTDAPATLCSEFEAGGELLSCVNRLSAAYRKSIYLHYYAGYSCKEIAESERITPSAMRSRLERARSKLKEELERSRV
jgi:RNA polymerase sigma-70 factor (ECF subfamily)